MEINYDPEIHDTVRIAAIYCLDKLVWEGLNDSKVGACARQLPQFRAGPSASFCACGTSLVNCGYRGRSGDVPRLVEEEGCDEQANRVSDHAGYESPQLWYSSAQAVTAFSVVLRLT